MEKINKQITVTFEFNVEDGTVSKLKCFSDGVESKKKTTTKASTKAKPVLEDKAIVILETNKLVLNNRCVSDLGLVWEDRVAIKYEKHPKIKKLIPTISKDESGNKLSKTNTVQYRGNANTILATYGSEFGLEVYKEDVWKLIPISENETIVEELEEIEEKAEELDVTILIDEQEEEIEIEELQFKL